nr:single-stranded DNA-binding protein [uncultured Caproiciproducens sp.]
MSDVNTLLDAAFQETNLLENGEVFLVRDLFKGYEWNRISRKDRLLLGTLFLNRVNNEHGFIKVALKTSSGQQRYQITKEV